MEQQTNTSDALEGSYRRTFRMQATGKDGQTARTTVPRDIVKREASRLGLSIRDFLKNYRVEWRYNGFEGAVMIFVPAKKDNNSNEG